MTIKNLEICFKKAIELNAKYIGVSIETRGSEGTEIIINPTCNFVAKLDYYKRAYDNDLVLKAYDGIRITGFTFGNSYSDIETDLTLQ